MAIEAWGERPGQAPSVIAYVDVNKMYFAVECLERPELDLAREQRPTVIGRDPDQFPRGIVTTCNQAARDIGIRSGLSTAVAQRLARERSTEVLFLPPRFSVYADYSRRLMALLREETPLLQQNSIDEAALDWGRHGFDVAEAVGLQRRIQARMGLSVSVGVARNLLVAKMASEEAKRSADGALSVLPGSEAAFLEAMPVRALIGVGPKAEGRLLERQISTIGALAAHSVADLADIFGPTYARYLHRASRGEDDGQLSDAREAVSQSCEHTFARDTADRAELWRTLRAQAGELAARLKADGVVAGEVAIKLRFSDRTTITRQERLAAPTDQAETMSICAAALMRRHWDPRRPLRLIGLRAARLGRPSGVAQLGLL